MSNHSTFSLVFKGLFGGSILAATASLYVLSRPPAETPPPADPQPTTVATAGNRHIPVSSAATEPWHRIPTNPNTTPPHLAEPQPPTPETFREIYEQSADLRDEQVEFLRQRINSGVGDDMSDEQLERLGLTRQDPQMVINKIQNEGVVVW